MTTPTPSIAVSPTDGLVDEPLDLRIEGLEPRAPVTVRAQARFSRNAGTWSTEARYIAGNDGALDLNAQAPNSGGFAVPDANALIWSLRPDDPATNARALAEGLAPYEIDLTVESGETVLRETILRRPVAELVNIAEIREPDLKLNLFLPEGAGPFPVVLVLGGSGGGFPDRQAALFASHGIAAVSLAYFGVEGLPPELRQIPLEYFERALAWISDHPLLQSERLAVSGTSRGGELALILASRYPQIRSVVAYVPSSHVWGAISRIEDDLPVDEFASWTHGGRSLPYAGRVRNDAVAPDAEGTIRLTPAYLAFLDDAARAGQAVIPVERIDGPVLLISGTNDALWPSATFGNLIAERARLNGFDFEVEHLTYDGAGHAIGAGIGPTTVNRSYHPIRKAYIDLGGTPEGLAKARADSWPRVLAFVARHTSAHRLVPDEVSPGMS